MTTRGEMADRAGSSGSFPDMHVTVSALLLTAVGAVALVLRLLRLDWLPLDPLESSVSLQAYRWVGGGTDTEIGTAPLVFHAQALVFWLLGGGEVQARLAAAACGLALIAAAWGLRPLLGAGPAIAASALFALHPVWVYAGRHVAGGTMAALALATVLTLWSRPGPRAAMALPIAAAVTLAAGGPGLPFLLTGLLALAAMVWRDRTEGIAGALRLRWPESLDRRRALAAFGIALLLAATAGLLRPDGLAALVDQPGAWLRQVVPGLGGAWSGFVLPLAIYGPDLLALGLVGIVLGARSSEPAPRFVAGWAAIALLLGSVMGTPAYLGQSLLPITLAAALAVGRLVEVVRERGRWSEDGVMAAILLVVLVYGLLQLLSFANAGDQATGLSAATLALGAFVLAALLACVFYLLWGLDVGRRVTGLTMLIFLSLLAWSNGSGLGYRTGSAPQELLRPEFVSPGARDVASAVAGSSWARTRDPNAWAVVVDPALEGALAWQLRERSVRWAAPEGSLDEAALVALSGGSPNFGPRAYRGQTHVVSGRWLPEFGDWHGFVRWWLQRRASPNAPSPDLARADLYIIAE